MGLWNAYVKHRTKQWDAKSPEERAAIVAAMNERQQANEARVAGARADLDAEWERSRVDHRARLDAEVLGGPAGAHVHGAVPDIPRPGEVLANPPSVRDDLRRSLRDLKDTASDLANPKGLLGIGSEFGAEPPLEQRREIERRERAARDAARQPYLGPNRVPAAITRIAARGESQFDDVAGFLARTGLARRPDLVFGVYRVPDRLDPKTPGSEAKRVVEWDVVHAPAQQLPPAPPPRRVRFDGEMRWVRRRKGEPSVLDEDVAIAWLTGLRIGPDRCLGIAREVVMQADDGWFGESDTANPNADVFARVLGVGVLLAADVPAPAGEIAVPPDGMPGVHVEVLNWAAVARAVHPRPQRQPEAPSPFPYLPSTPQEVLTSYLEIVGVQPSDCYAAEVTIDRLRECGEVRDRTDGQLSAATFRLTDAVELPCADGTLRRRLHGGTRVVVAYRDSAAYAAGRERWAAYQREVLFARLHLQTEARRTIADAHEDLGIFGGLVRGIERLDNAYERITSFGAKAPAHKRFENQVRYCEPLG
jgi:hypothetical protein